VPDGDYAKVVERVRPEAARLRGEIVDESGRVLGEHRGVHHFTVGQRHGLGISADRRLYVLRIDPREQKVTVGDATDLDCGGAEVERMNWISGVPPTDSIAVRVQVRHRHSPVLARVEPMGASGARVRFEEPVRAVAPGQAAVFYDAEHDDEVIGGGWLVGGLR
jgi:tRNA-specific 2-thiouridylase